MSTSQHAFAAEHYGSRAGDYVRSAVHSAGEDLDQIEAEMRGRADAHVLDLGCGGGHVSYRAAPHVARVVACDVAPGMLDAVAATAAERGLSNISVQQAPAETLPFPGRTFDVVLCRYTMHHWHDMEAGLREGRRVLKPDGLAIFVDTVAPNDRVLDSHLQCFELLRDPSHVRNYSVPELVWGLSRSGFAIDRLAIGRLRMDFPVWVARTRTPPAQAEAIRTLQEGAPASVRRHFAVEPDGSFELERATAVTHAT